MGQLEPAKQEHSTVSARSRLAAVPSVATPDSSAAAVAAGFVQAQNEESARQQSSCYESSRGRSQACLSHSGLAQILEQALRHLNMRRSRRANSGPPSIGGS